MKRTLPSKVWLAKLEMEFCKLTINSVKIGKIEAVSARACLSQLADAMERPSRRSFIMVAESHSPVRTWIARTFTAVEDIMYIGLGMLLALSAGVLLVSAIGRAATSLMAGTFVRDMTILLDRMLLILLIVEVLYTVQVSFREHTLMPEPFLLVGLIAAIRRVLLLTAEFGHPGSSGAPGIELLLWELGVLTALILSLALSLALLRKRGRPVVTERAK